MIFDVVIKDNDMISEDIIAFMKLSDGGFKIWLDPNMTCNHIGPYKFTGDFRPWFKNGMRVNPIPGLPAVQSAASQQPFKIPTLPRKQL
jgi:hypothetical protein